MNLYERLLNKRRKLPDEVGEFCKLVVEYFEWADDTPLLEEQIYQYGGGIIRANKAKMRPFTKQGLAAFLGTTVARLEARRKLSDKWSDALDMIDQVIFEQKFSGAAVGLFNAGIITRDLGLTDKTEVNATGNGVTVPVTFDIHPVARGTFIPEETE